MGTGYWVLGIGYWVFIGNLSEQSGDPVLNEEEAGKFETGERDK